MMMFWWWITLGAAALLVVGVIILFLAFKYCQQTANALPSPKPVHKSTSPATSKSLKKSDAVRHAAVTPRVIHTSAFTTYPTQYLSVTNLPTFIASQTGLTVPTSAVSTEDINRRQTLPDPTASPQATPHTPGSAVTYHQDPQRASFLAAHNGNEMSLVNPVTSKDDADRRQTLLDPIPQASPQPSPHTPSNFFQNPQRSSYLTKPHVNPISQDDINRRQTIPDPSPQATPQASPQPSPHTPTGTVYWDQPVRVETKVVRISFTGDTINVPVPASNFDTPAPATLAASLAADSSTNANLTTILHALTTENSDLMNAEMFKPKTSIDMTVFSKLSIDDDNSRGGGDESEWWQRNLSASTYRLTRDLARDSPALSSPKMPFAIQKKRDSLKPNKLERELTKEWARSKQSVDLLDFLRESPDDYMVIDRSGAMNPAGNFSDDLESPDTGSNPTFGPEVMSARGPGDRALSRGRQSFKLDTSIAERSIQEKEASAVWGDFNLLLRSRVGLECFLEFLKANWSAENLLFYQAVDEIRQTPKLELVVTVFEDFVKNDACSMVNLRGSTQTRIAQEMERVRQESQVTVEMLQHLEDAQHEIFRLMENDLFPRFITGKQCESWKVECRKAVAELHAKGQKHTLTRSMSSALLKRKEKTQNSQQS